MLGSVIPASQPGSNKNRLRFRDNHRSSYDTPLSVFRAFNGCECGGSRHAKIKGKPGYFCQTSISSTFHITCKFICGRLTNFSTGQSSFHILVYNPSSGFAVQRLPSTLALAILSSLTPRFLGQ
jgi:hypothetical protein